MVINTYHEYILEGMSALVLGLHLHKQALQDSPDFPTMSGRYALTNCRYTFLMINNALESAANALIGSLKIDKDVYNEFEKISTLKKFHVFTNLQGKSLDTGDVRYSNMKELIKCRNEFVHPKPKHAIHIVESNPGESYLKVSSTNSGRYPLYFDALTPEHVITALQDTLSFIAWIVFDICKFNIQEGALLIGSGSLENNDDIVRIEYERNITLDKRSFGIE
ncbi:MAG: hypothetical protein K1X91_02710 [Bacteriodetes bacterium]|nr:hypothetical protein [Bacteroidota bacterium]